MSIKILATADEVHLDFAFDTPEEFYYTYAVTDAAGVAKQGANGRWDGTTSFDLGDGTSLVGLFLDITWTVIDPAGPGNNFSATATVSQKSTVCPAIQSFTGVSANPSVSNVTSDQFTI